MAASTEEVWIACAKSLEQSVVVEHWTADTWFELRDTLERVNSLSEITKPPVLFSNTTAGLAFALASLCRKTLTERASWDPGAVDAGACNSRVTSQLLTVTARFLYSTHLPDASTSVLLVRDALTLAQQVTKSELLPAVEDTLWAAVVSINLGESTATTADIAFALLVLRLEFAVCNMWPQGILKSSAAGPTAAPAAALAVAVLKRAGRQEQQDGFRAALALSEIAAFSQQLVQQLPSRLSQQPGVPHIQQLVASPDFLLLLLLVLHAQLQRQWYAADTGDNPTARAAARQQRSAFLRQLVAKVSRESCTIWCKLPCWQQCSTLSDCAATVQLLSQLISSYWVGQSSTISVANPRRLAVFELLAEVPVLLLALARSCWQQQQQQQEGQQDRGSRCLFEAAVEAAAASTACWGALHGLQVDLPLRQLLKLWAELMQLVAASAAPSRPAKARDASGTANSSNSSSEQGLGPQHAPDAAPAAGAAAGALQAAGNSTSSSSSTAAAAGAAITASSAAAFNSKLQPSIKLLLDLFDVLKPIGGMQLGDVSKQVSSSGSAAVQQQQQQQDGSSEAPAVQQQYLEDWQAMTVPVAAAMERGLRTLYELERDSRTLSISASSVQVRDWFRMQCFDGEHAGPMVVAAVATATAAVQQQQQQDRRLRQLLSLMVTAVKAFPYDDVSILLGSPPHEDSYGDLPACVETAAVRIFTELQPTTTTTSSSSSSSSVVVQPAAAPWLVLLGRCMMGRADQVRAALSSVSAAGGGAQAYPALRPAAQVPAAQVPAAQVPAAQVPAAAAGGGGGAKPAPLGLGPMPQQPAATRPAHAAPAAGQEAAAAVDMEAAAALDMEAAAAQHLKNEDDLVTMLLMFLSSDPSQAVCWTEAEDAAVNEQLVPLSWEQHYLDRYGSIVRFMQDRPAVFCQISVGYFYKAPNAEALVLKAKQATAAESIWALHRSIELASTTAHALANCLGRVCAPAPAAAGQAGSGSSTLTQQQQGQASSSSSSSTAGAAAIQLIGLHRDTVQFLVPQLSIAARVAAGWLRWQNDNALAVLPSSWEKNIPQGLSPLLQRIGDSVCAQLPVSCCCNNPDCLQLAAAATELQLVGGKRCICAGCMTARYCSKHCQKRHWQQHKPVCQRLKAAAAMRAAVEAAAAAAEGRQ